MYTFLIVDIDKVRSFQNWYDHNCLMKDTRILFIILNYKTVESNDQRRSVRQWFDQICVWSHMMMYSHYKNQTTQKQ